MNLSAAALRLMAAKGLSLDDVAEIVAANEQRPDPTNAQRQARHREKKRAESNGVTVTRYAPLNEEDNLNPPSYSDEAIASSSAAQPTAEAARIWNDNAKHAGWPSIKSLSPNRSRILSARLREHGVDGWRSAVTRARASPFLGGTDPPHWFTFPWLIKAENFAKLIEGNYDRRQPANTLGRHQPSDGLSSTARAAVAVFGAPSAGQH